MKRKAAPVPGGPWNKRCGNLLLSINLLRIWIISSCAINSSSELGRYFSTHGSVSLEFRGALALEKSSTTSISDMERWNFVLSWCTINKQLKFQVDKDFFKHAFDARGGRYKFWLRILVKCILYRLWSKDVMLVFSKYFSKIQINLTFGFKFQKSVIIRLKSGLRFTVYGLQVRCVFRKSC